MTVHPVSGLHYVNVFPRNVVFDEIHQSYKVASESSPWMSTASADEAAPSRDPSVLQIFWQSIPDRFLESGSRKALRYTESMPVDQSRTENQKSHFSHLEKVSSSLDFLIVHTPTAAEILGGYAKNVILAPIGFEASVYGVPDWSVPKAFDIGFYGSMVGNRVSVIEAIRARYGDRFLAFGAFGAPRKNNLDRCRISLYVGHCDDPSFATTRLWQTIAGSAPLVAEGVRDAWPAIPGRHYLRLPKVDPSDLSGFMEALDAVAGRDDLEAVARSAYSELSKVTVQYSMESFVVPGAGSL